MATNIDLWHHTQIIKNEFELVFIYLRYFEAVYEINDILELHY